VKYHGLARRYLMPTRLLMRPLLNGGTLGRLPGELDALGPPIVLVHQSPSFDFIEDRHICDPQVPLYAVFDGESARGVASQLAAETFHAERTRLVGAKSVTAAAILEEALQAANRRILKLATGAHPNIGGTTCTACTLTEDDVVVVHVGDGRLYVAREHAWHRVTVGHSLQEDVAARAELPDPDGIAETLSTVVTRALGLLDRVQVDIYTVPLAGITALLLCTDGAWRPLASSGTPGCIPFDNDPAVVGEAMSKQYRVDGARDDATLLIVPCGSAG
jgi:PPM family protein phosphatase